MLCKVLIQKYCLELLKVAQISNLVIRLYIRIMFWGYFSYVEQPIFFSQNEETIPRKIKIQIKFYD